MRPLLALLLSAWTVVVAAAEAKRPNILFFIMDDWGNGHAGAYGCPWVKTPNFDRVAREGLLFMNAYTPTAKCTPSRSTIMTGRHPWQLGAAANHQCIFPPEYGIFPDALKAGGYAYATTGKVWGPGSMLDAQGKLRPYAGKAYNQIKVAPPTTGISPNDYAANFAAFLEDATTGQPWFFWAGPVEPHRDYEYGSGARLAGKKPSDIDRVPGYWPDNDTVRNDLLDYAYEVEHADRHLGRMLSELERRGLLDDTLIIVTSDNGMPFPRVKGHTYENANHLPLAIRWPKGIRAPGRKVEAYMSFVDLAPTFLEAAGVAWSQSGLAPSPGRSLFDVFADAPEVAKTRDHVLIGRERTDLGRPNDAGYPVRGIVKGGQLYLENAEPTRWPCGNPETGYLDTDASPTKSFILQARRDKGADPHWDLCFGLRPARELYDLRADPDCLNNLLGYVGGVLTVPPEALRAQLWAELKAQGDLRAVGRGAEYEAYPSADVKKRGFYERYLRGEKIDASWASPTDFEKAPLK
jgi:N-sulfoglucosamine sulfohydrolase